MADYADRMPTPQRNPAGRDTTGGDGPESLHVADGSQRVARQDSRNSFALDWVRPGPMTLRERLALAGKGGAPKAKERTAAGDEKLATGAEKGVGGKEQLAVSDEKLAIGAEKGAETVATGKVSAPEAVPVVDAPAVSSVAENELPAEVPIDALQADAVAAVVSADGGSAVPPPAAQLGAAPAEPLAQVDAERELDATSDLGTDGGMNALGGGEMGGDGVTGADAGSGAGGNQLGQGESGDNKIGDKKVAGGKKEAAAKGLAGSPAKLSGPPTGGLDGKGGAAQLAPTPLDGSSEGALLRSVTGYRGMDMVRALEASGKRFVQVQGTARGAAKAGLPAMSPPTGLPGRLGKAPAWAQAKASPGKRPTPKVPGMGAPWKLPTAHKVPETKGFWQRYADMGKWSKPATPEKKEQTQAIDRLHALVHSNETPAVDTTLDVNPKVPLTGAADPAVAHENAGVARQQTAVELQRQQAETRADFGEGQILPEAGTGLLRPAGERSKGAEYSYGNAPLPGIQAAHAGILDMDAEAMLRAEADKCSADSLAADATYEQEKGEAVAKGQASIAEEESATAGRQLEAKGSNAKEVAGLRNAWQEANEGVLAELDARTEAERAAMEADIDGQCRDTEGAVGAEVDAAQQQAAAQRKKAEEKVAQKRAEAKKKEGEKSWFDMAVDAVKGFFAELTAFVTQVFEDLRGWVKQKFEQVKQWVVAKIEQARQAIVGAIKWFGEKLKGFVDFAFQAFPQLRDKFKARIDQAMDATVDFVNKQAERLKVFAQKALDLMAAGVDMALQAMEMATVGLLKALETVAVLAIQMAEYFYNMLLDAILKVGTLVAFVGLVASGFLLGFMWDFLGESTKEYLIDLLFDVGIWVFENAPDDMGLGVVWPMFVHGMLGFLYEADETPMVQKKQIMQKVSDILTGKDNAFMWNFVVNVFVGIWEAFSGIFIGIWELLKFLTGGLWEMMGEMMTWLQTALPHIAETIALMVGDVEQFVADFRKEGPEKLQAILDSKNIQKVLDFLNGLGDSLRVEAQVMGARAASGMRDFLLSGAASAKIGEMLGKLYGNIIFEVVLAVLTVGIGTAIKAGLRAMRWVLELLSKLGRGGKMLLHVIEFLGKGFRWLVGVVKKLGKKFMELGDKLMAKFDDLYSGIERRIDDLIAKLRGKVDDAPHHKAGPDVDGPDGPRRKQGEQDLDDDPHRKKGDDDDPDNKRKKDEDDPEHDGPGTETTSIQMLETPHSVRIRKGKLAKVIFGAMDIDTHLRQAKTHEKSTEGMKIDAGLMEVRVKAEAVEELARLRPKARVLNSSAFRSFKAEVQEFARKFEASSFGHIADKKGVEEKEFFTMSGERHQLWYDSDDAHGEFWMASGAGKFLTTKIDGQIRTCNEILLLISEDASYRIDAMRERSLMQRLTNMKVSFLNAMAMHRSNRAASGPARIDRKTFVARVNKSVLELASALHAEGSRSFLSDLEFVEFHLYFGVVKKVINNLRKHMPAKPPVVGDGHSNSAASAEHFGWSHAKGQHWERRSESKRDLSENLGKIRELETRHGGTYTKSKLFLDGEMERMDCMLSVNSPRQYLIYNHVRSIGDLWKAFFPHDTYSEFMDRKQYNWINRTVNDPRSPTRKSKKRYRP